MLVFGFPLPYGIGQCGFSVRVVLHLLSPRTRSNPEVVASRHLPIRSQAAGAARRASRVVIQRLDVLPAKFDLEQAVGDLKGFDQPVAQDRDPAVEAVSAGLVVFVLARRGTSAVALVAVVFDDRAVRCDRSRQELGMPRDSALSWRVGIRKERLVACYAIHSANLRLSL